MVKGKQWFKAGETQQKSPAVSRAKKEGVPLIRRPKPRRGGGLGMVPDNALHYPVPHDNNNIFPLQVIVNKNRLQFSSELTDPFRERSAIKKCR